MIRLGQRASWWSAFLVLPLGILGAVAARFALLLPVIHDNLLGAFPPLDPVFLAHGVADWFRFLAVVAGGAAGLFLVASLCGLHRRRWTLALLRKAYVAAYALAWLYGFLLVRATHLLRVERVDLTGAGNLAGPDAVTVFFWRWHLFAPVLGAVLVVAFLHLLTWRREVITLYGGPPDAGPARGDVVLENLRTHGADPRYRKSVWTSSCAHVFFIVILPWLLSLGGCVDPYRIPKGSGEPVVLVKVVKQKKEKKKRYLLNPQSAISFRVPELDERVLREVLQTTELTYTADPNRVTAAMGAGKGTKGGWPDGMDDAVVRFIRLEYDGPQWNDGMDDLTRADRNFLEEFHRVTGFKVADKSESHPIRLLKKYRAGFAPPFVYMTGDGFIRVPESDLKILREYLIDGGMLFADCGSAQWDASFRSFARQLFPSEELRVIADDDPLFQLPYAFPNGAPRLWHHGGDRALGIKHKGRWVVFYHPGDINDAWKTGHSGLASHLAEGAFQMGINIIYYSFTHYLEMTRHQRK